jgi:hypothetical protein
VGNTSSPRQQTHSHREVSDNSYSKKSADSENGDASTGRDPLQYQLAVIGVNDEQSQGK